MARRCPECRGTGIVTEWKLDSDGNRYPGPGTCERCGGKGEVE